MARVIKIDETKELKRTHAVCGALIGYTKNEVTVEYIDTAQLNFMIYKLICPYCHKEIQWTGGY